MLETAADTFVLIRTLATRHWAHAQPSVPRVVAVPVPGKISRAFRDGSALSARCERGALNCADYQAQVDR